ncbi:U32 family peptidase [Phaeovibrio sulfidiphilus]|uniref:U32 family peptidase n=1 Tax=Phaeovibrio sulfidiphilus TaxID=1220600 RepID=A0A8J7CNN8_9PROT|nr:U32 family peptidase [Phaeovibrio sulfidiphilus]MBE1236107.1 U32 family peptidase [Phaeovibrio sulfidiphilus]
MSRVEIALGPLTYNWQNPAREALYSAAATEEAFDIVYIGETVCAKRIPVAAAVMADAAETLEKAGRKVVYSALSLATNESERRQVTDLCEVEDLLVEANDAGALRTLAGRPHFVGPHMNVYNPGTLEALAERGAVSFCLPWEVNRKGIEVMARRANDLGVVVEIEVFGKAPLAISARCHHARAYGFTKDSCQYVCDRDPEGMAVRTLDGQNFLTLNGLQTQGHAVTLLVSEVQALRDMGVGRLRLSPMNMDMNAVARVYRDLLDGRTDAATAEQTLLGMLGDREPANGFYYGVEGSTWAA